MMKMTVKQIRELGLADTVSHKEGVFTLRRGFFYRHGMDAEQYAAGVVAALPGAVVVGKGEVNKAFSGGASTANYSHWWVKITFPNA